MSNQIIFLVDINNAYCSFERVFNPGLIDRAVVVTSNNDSAIVARSADYVELNCNRKITLTQ